MNINVQEKANSLILIFGTTAALCLVLMVIRAKIIGFGWSALKAPLTTVPRIILGAYHDLLFVGILSLFFLMLYHLARTYSRIRGLILLAYILAVILTLGFALINIISVEMLGSPFNYRWLYFSDFLGGHQMRQTIQSVLSWDLFLVTATVGFGMVIISLVFVWLINIALRKYITGRNLLLAMAALCLLYFPFAGWYLKNVSEWDYIILENPAFSFMYSVIVQDTPKIFTMDTTVGPEDFQVAAESSIQATPIENQADSGIRNVLIYIMESVPAEYMEAYGGKYPVTPELNKYQDQSIVFRNVYAHAPSSNKSLVSMLCSIYPWVSYLTLTNEYPAAPLTCLSNQLKQQGYRTAFFSSGDMSYLGANRFLENRQFDVVQDHRARFCNQPTHTGSSVNDSEFDGSDEVCTADSFIKWVEANPNHPFFAAVWTNMTHYPYYVSGEEIDFNIKRESAWEVEFFNRYLNGLHHTDLALGKILQMLDEKGLAESTLVVVVGDHGEAFGKHGQYGHGSNIYEENVHVPLILINPRLFKGEEHPAVGGLIDLAPTITDLLELPLPGGWQGRSLFSVDRSQRIYFFSSWKEFTFGYREADQKFIFNASTNEYEVYNLQKDPDETTNLATNASDEIIMIQQRLAAWVQYQNRLIENLSSMHEVSLQ